MSTPTPPAPKTSGTKITPVTSPDNPKHDEWALDEALDEGFPASDPAAIPSPGSTQTVKKLAEEGRAIPPDEADPAMADQPLKKKPDPL